jgi:hypothetical protein
VTSKPWVSEGWVSSDRKACGTLTPDAAVVLRLGLELVLAEDRLVAFVVVGAVSGRSEANKGGGDEEKGLHEHTVAMGCGLVGGPVVSLLLKVGC